LGIFINCPFDEAYRPIFEAIVFTVTGLGFVPRCALEVQDSGEIRLDKILRIISECRFAIHDLSAVGLGSGHGLPRFNMPFELGLDLGCRRFGSNRHRRKASLILDSERFRYQIFISDIAGQDIQAHENKPEVAIRKVRDWLANSTRVKSLPGGQAMAERYAEFRLDLPSICRAYHRRPEELTYGDYLETLQLWLSASR
jgi:hypothetical protein